MAETCHRWGTEPYYTPKEYNLENRDLLPSSDGLLLYASSVKMVEFLCTQLKLDINSQIGAEKNTIFHNALRQQSFSTIDFEKLLQLPNVGKAARIIS